MLTFIVSSSLTEITREHGERDNTDTHGRRGTGMVADGERGKRLRRESRKTERVHACIQRSRNYGKRGWNAVSTYAFFCSPSRATRNCAQR